MEIPRAGEKPPPLRYINGIADWNNRRSGSTKASHPIGRMTVNVNSTHWRAL